MLAPCVFDEVVVIQSGRVYGSGWQLLDARPSTEVCRELWHAYADSWGLYELYAEAERELQDPEYLKELRGE